jgi:hypothetical protein
VISGVLDVGAGGMGAVGTFNGSINVTGEVTAMAGAGFVTVSQHRHPAINAPPTPGT